MRLLRGIISLRIQATQSAVMRYVLIKPIHATLAEELQAKHALKHWCVPVSTSVVACD